MNKDLILAALLATALHAGAIVSLGLAIDGPAVFNAEETGIDVIMIALAPDPVEPETPGHPLPDTPAQQAAIEQAAPVMEPALTVLPVDEPTGRRHRAAAPSAVVDDAPVVELEPTPAEPPAPTAAAPLAAPMLELTTVRAAQAALDMHAADVPSGAARLADLPDVVATPTPPASAATEQPAAATPATPESGRAARATQPAIIRNVPPGYPPAARRRGEEGVVVLRVQVLPDGRCGAVEIRQSSGHGILDDAAVSAIAAWRFRPGTRSGRPESMWVLVPIEFDLRD